MTMNCMEIKRKMRAAGENFGKMKNISMENEGNCEAMGKIFLSPPFYSYPPLLSHPPLFKGNFLPPPFRSSKKMGYPPLCKGGGAHYGCA